MKTDPLLVSATLLDLADRHAPGLVEGLHLQGSIALDDYRPGRSDIDFVAVVSRPPRMDELRAIHTGLRRMNPTQTNLDTYWTAWAKRPALTAWAVEWGVLGVTRLRHTLAAGRVTSKTAAADHGLATYDEKWHRILQEARRIRVGGPALYRDPFTRARDTYAYMRMVLRG